MKNCSRSEDDVQLERVLYMTKDKRTSDAAVQRPPSGGYVMSLAMSSVFSCVERRLQSANRILWWHHCPEA